MSIKAVSFDIGHTLVKYNNPLNWKSLYGQALEHASRECGVVLSRSQLQMAETILSKYNTRENPREKEVSSGCIFKEILDVWAQPYDKLESAKTAFYRFFQADAVCYNDVVDTLRHLKLAGIKIGALTDVAYGMDNSFSLRDIEGIHQFFDLVLTSVDVGYRKPNSAGFLMLLSAFDVAPSEMLFVGDEQKDIIGANRLDIISVLIDRSGGAPVWGQCFTIKSLLDICGML